MPIATPLLGDFILRKSLLGEFGEAFLLFACLILLVVPLILYIRIRFMFKKYSIELGNKELTGAYVAKRIFDFMKISGIKIILSKIPSNYYCGYSAYKKCVYLSACSYEHATIAASCAAAHECAHVIQFEKNYFLTKMIKFFGGLFSITFLVWWIFDLFSVSTVDFESGYTYLTKYILLSLGVIVYLTYFALCVCMVFSESDANKRALKVLSDMEIFTGDELRQIKNSLKYMCVSSIIYELGRAM